MYLALSFFLNACPSLRSVCISTYFPVYVLFLERIIPLIHVLAVQTVVSSTHNCKTCLLFSVDLEMKANCFHLSSPFPPALSVSFCFCQTHIFRSLSPWRLPRNTPSPEIFFQFVCFCLSDHWRCPGPDPAATESDLRLWHLSLIVWYVQPKLIGWNSCQGLHTRKKALVC